VSAHGRDEFASEALAAGVDAFLPKPVTPSALLDATLLVMGHRSEDRTQITAAGEAENRLRGARILLVEDNIVNQRVALRILEKLGFSAEAKANGAEAVDALASTAYDLVFMDVQMPVMDGYEATAQIRDPASAVLDHDIPIIAMTAHSMQGDRDRCIEAGMNDYIAKPITPKTLGEIVQKWHSALAEKGAADDVTTLSASP